MNKWMNITYQINNKRIDVFHIPPVNSTLRSRPTFLAACIPFA